MTQVSRDGGIFTHEGEIVGYSHENILPHWKVTRKMNLNRK